MALRLAASAAAIVSYADSLCTKPTARSRSPPQIEAPVVASVAHRASTDDVVLSVAAACATAGGLEAFAL